MPSKLCYTVQQSPLAIIISGSTFNYKEQLKALGATWDPSRKAWVLLGQEDTDVIRDQLEPSPTPEQRDALLLQQRQERAERKAMKLWEQSKEGKKARVVEALKNHRSTYHWICCEDCEVIDWKRATSYCLKHADGENAFRVRGCIFTGD